MLGRIGAILMLCLFPALCCSVALVWARLSGFCGDIAQSSLTDTMSVGLRGVQQYVFCSAPGGTGKLVCPWSFGRSGSIGTTPTNEFVGATRRALRFMLRGEGVPPLRVVGILRLRGASSCPRTEGKMPSTRKSKGKMPSPRTTSQRAEPDVAEEDRVVVAGEGQRPLRLDGLVVG